MPLAQSRLDRITRFAFLFLSSLLAAFATAACGGAGAPVRDGGGLDSGGGLDASALACTPSPAPLATSSDPWQLTVTPTTPVPMDDVTVFVLSQVIDHAGDPQVPALAPDMSIRAWPHWDQDGRHATDYDRDYLAGCHAAGIRVMGGQTTVTFEDEWSPTAFQSVATRDSRGALVPHDDIFPKLHFGSWSNPVFRDDLLAIAELQIDAGADGVFFDVMEGDFTGAAFDGDEGFDDNHLADFNGYLLAKYPGSDFAALFGMPPDNRLRADLPIGDLACNFDYRRYLTAKGWAGNPFTNANPLAKEWASSNGNRRQPPGLLTFEPAVNYRQFLAVTTALRRYARETYGRDIFITANGIFPYVDFQSVGLYDYNHDGDGGAEADYVPVANGHLDGGRSLKATFSRLAEESAALAPGAPVVLFVDWPSGPMTRYLGLPAPEREDYWRIYAAEAYANGLFFALHLADTVGDPSATDLGLMPLFQHLTTFYKAQQALYHHVIVSSVELGLADIMATVTDQVAPRRRIVHLVNHRYAAGLVAQQNVAIVVPVSSVPTAVSMVSPDITGSTSLPFTYAAGTATVTVPTLVAYNVLLFSY